MAQRKKAEAEEKRVKYKKAREDFQVMLEVHPQDSTGDRDGDGGETFSVAL